MRGTSVLWVERRIKTARAKARRTARRNHINDHNLSPAEPCAARKAYMAHERRKRAAARPARADQGEDAGDEMPIPAVFGEIWPPVPAPRGNDVTVTVTSVLVSKSDVGDAHVDPVIGVDHAYCDYTFTHIRETSYGFVLQNCPEFEVFKPP